MKSVLRLRRAADFARVKRFGKSRRSRECVISVCENGLSHNRYGIVAGRRLGGAVARNRCKRRLRAILRSLHQKSRQGYDVVVIPRRPMLGQPSGALRRILVDSFAQVRLLGSR